MTLQFDDIHVFALVFVRMAGLMLISPLFGHRTVPSQVRVGLVFALTLLLAPPLTGSFVPDDSFDMLLAMFRELMLGFMSGFVYQIFYYMLLFVGDWMDTDFGMSMAKVFDPGTNMQMSISGNMLTILFTLYILATDCHLVLLHLFALSFKIVPVGAAAVSPEAFKFVLQLFVEVFSLALRLLLPFTVVEFALQIVLGIMMKLVPQIHVFVINFQLKLALGLFMFLLLCPTILSFLDNYINIMLENIERAITLLA